MKTIQVNAAQLESVYIELTGCATAECTLITRLVGGVPAGENGVRAFVRYQMHLEGDEADNAVRRIMLEEIGQSSPVLSNGEELDDREVYGINVIRRDEHGPWLGNWQVKACLKAAASRLGLFQTKRGLKGDIAEMGRVRAVGISRLGESADHIYLCGGQTYFDKFMGRVGTPQGAKSIVHWSEVAPQGSRFAFEARFAPSRLNERDCMTIFAAAQNIGLGSCKALECGKFRIDKLTIELPEKLEKPEKKDKADR